MSALLNADVSGRLATLVPAWRADESTDRPAALVDRRRMRLVRGIRKSNKENIK